MQPKNDSTNSSYTQIFHFSSTSTSSFHCLGQKNEVSEGQKGQLEGKFTLTRR